MFTIAAVTISEVQPQFDAVLPRFARFLAATPPLPGQKPAIYALVDLEEQLQTTYHFLCLPAGATFMLPPTHNLSSLQYLGCIILQVQAAPSQILRTPSGLHQGVNGTAQFQDFHIFVMKDNE